ncbi:MAG: GNAT family N-acetyltransferase [Clostridia bacterium]|nr:GNAT family N-acetyltransferase [Clostridia bacterium]
MIRLQTVREKDKELFWNINQKYLYEMTSYYPDEMDKQGNYHYGYFDAYFVEPERKVFFIFNDKKLIGFVMLNPYSVIGHNPDYTIAEFTIFPSYRRKHYALEAAKLILSSYPGQWEIKFNEKNVGAKNLWTAITASYNPHVYHLNDQETVLEFSN